MLTRFKKFTFFLIVLPIMTILPCVSQAVDQPVISNSTAVETINGNQTTIDIDYEEMFDMFKSDMFEGIFGAILDHIWVVLLIFITILLILYMVIHYISKIMMFITGKFASLEYFEIGKIKIKNRSYVDNSKNKSSTELNISEVLSVLNALLKSSIKNIIIKTIDLIEKINDTDSSYQNRYNDIFNDTFTVVLNELRDMLIEHCIKITGFTIVDIHKTREYFFINDFISTIENNWKRKSKDIIVRNGFEKADSNLDYVRNYIDELHQCVLNSINHRYLEAIEVTRQSLIDIIKKCFDNTDQTFEKMFRDLGKIKQSYLEKKVEKDKHIDDIVTDSVKEIITTVNITIKKSFDSSSDQIEDKTSFNKKDIKSEKEN